ncbi:MAG: carboxyl transferase, partial [Clostridiales bacterium]|nr:carboxyl transferase [Clostridiales bacterium]
MELNTARYELNDTPGRRRLNALFDDGSFSEIDAYVKSGDAAVEVVAGYGTVAGIPACAFAQYSAVDGGAVSQAQCAKVKKVYDFAVKTGCPVVGFYDSNGVRLQEGLDVLGAYGEMLQQANQLSGVVPQISVVLGPCVGTSALVAVSADIVIMEQDAQLYLNPAAKTSAQDCLASGLASLVANGEEEAVAKAQEVLSKLPMNNLSPAPAVDFAPDDALLNGDGAALLGDMPGVMRAVADAGSVTELNAGYGAAVQTALATLEGNTAGFVTCTGAELCRDACEKAAKFVRFCDAFHLPVVTLVHTAGFDQSREAEESGLLRHVSRLSAAYAQATAPKVTVIAGDAIGSSYIALAGKGAGADLVFAWKDAVISPLEADAAVSILYQNRLAAGEE